VEGAATLAAHSLHRPWVDAVRVRCRACGTAVARVPDVGTPWLDAAAVPFATTGWPADPSWRDWFPADLVAESSPGQFRNWFYALLVEGVVLAGRAPYRAVLGHHHVVDASGAEMHKSTGNAVLLEEALERHGAEPLRWALARADPARPWRYGDAALAAAAAALPLPLWHLLRLYEGAVARHGAPPCAAGWGRDPVDRWLADRCDATTRAVRAALDGHDPPSATAALEELTADLAGWYVRRLRERLALLPPAQRARALAPLRRALATLARLVAPFLPFLAETAHRVAGGAGSVHLADYPAPRRCGPGARADAAARARGVAAVRAVGALARRARADAGVRARQPLPALAVRLPPRTRPASGRSRRWRPARRTSSRWCPIRATSSPSRRSGRASGRATAPTPPPSPPPSRPCRPRRRCASPPR